MSKVTLNTLYTAAALISLIVAPIIGIIRYNARKKEKETETYDKCLEEYNKITDKQKELENSLLEAYNFEVLPERKCPEYKNITKQNGMIFDRTFSAFISFYNDLNKFCMRFNNDTFNGKKVEGLIRSDILNYVFDHADYQIEIFKCFKENNEVYKLRKHVYLDYMKYSEIDKFLKKHNKYRFDRIKESRNI